MRRFLLVPALLPLFATDPSWPPPDAPYVPDSDFPDDIAGVTCGREITCLDGAKVSCDGAPAGECEYVTDKCIGSRHVKGYVKCGTAKEECNNYSRCR